MALAAEETPLRVGEVVRAYREARGISARQLSLQAGLSESYVGKLEAGEMACSLTAFSKLAVTLRMKAGEIHAVVCAEAAE